MLFLVVQQFHVLQVAAETRCEQVGGIEVAVEAHIVQGKIHECIAAAVGAVMEGIIHPEARIARSEFEGFDEVQRAFFARIEHFKQFAGSSSSARLEHAAGGKGKSCKQEKTKLT